MRTLTHAAWTYAWQTPTGSPGITRLNSPILVLSATCSVASFRPLASARYTQFSSIIGSTLVLDFPLDFALVCLQWLLLIVLCLNQCLRRLLRLRLLLLDLLLHLLVVPARATPDGWVVYHLSSILSVLRVGMFNLLLTLDATSAITGLLFYARLCNPSVVLGSEGETKSPSSPSEPPAVQLPLV